MDQIKPLALDHLRACALLICSLFCLGAANAAWQLEAPMTSLQYQARDLATLQIQIKNVGDSIAPAQSLIAETGWFIGAPLLQAFQITPIAGDCGPWLVPAAAVANVSFSIPALGAGATLNCEYQVRHLNTPYSGSVDLSFKPGGIRILMGGATDVAAYARLVSSLPTANGRFRNRYQIVFENRGDTHIERYGFGGCQPPIDFSVISNTGDLCRLPPALHACFAVGQTTSFTGGPLGPRASASCAIETIGSASPTLGFIYQHQRIYDALGNRYYDINPYNNALELRGNASLLAAPSLSCLGALAIMMGVLLGARIQQQK